MPNVVIFGATGFIGIPLTKAIKAARPEWILTAFVRTGKDTASIQSLLDVDHVKTRDLTDFETVKAVSKAHEIVVNAASSKDESIVAPMIAGAIERFEDKKVKGKLIHISGAGNFIDHGLTGEFNPTSKVWNDNNEDDIKAITKDMVKGPADISILKAGAEGRIDTYIICSSVTYGNASVNSKDLGIGYQRLTDNTRSLGFVPYVGTGSAVVSMTHILDLIPFVLQILEMAISRPATASPYSCHYMVQTERVTWKDLTTEMA